MSFANECYQGIPNEEFLEQDVTTPDETILRYVHASNINMFANRFAGYYGWQPISVEQSEAWWQKWQRRYTDLGYCAVPMELIYPHVIALQRSVDPVDTDALTVRLREAGLLCADHLPEEQRSAYFDEETPAPTSSAEQKPSTKFGAVVNAILRLLRVS